MNGTRPAPRKGGLSPAGEEILLAVLPVVLGTLLPADPTVRTRALDDAMWALDDYLAHLSLPLQRQARGLLAALRPLPARLVLLGTTRRWRDAPPARIEGFLRRARRSRLPVLRRIYDFLQSMTVIAWFDLPVAWTEIGYPGPPIERPFGRGDSP
ncbi:MAG: hypothetical protein U0807_14605 [Candidatus Binatia bacterium]